MENKWRAFALWWASKASLIDLFRKQTELSAQRDLCSEYPGISVEPTWSTTCGSLGAEDTQLHIMKILEHGNRKGFAILRRIS